MKSDARRAHSSGSDSVWYLWHALVLLILGASPTARASPSTDPFAHGSRYWSVTAGVSHHESIAWVYLTELSVSYYLVDDLAIECGQVIGYVNANRTRPGALGGQELGLRWHVTKGKRWSTYLEALAGVVLQQSPLTDHSLRFNFDLRPGVGATYRFRDHLMLEGGFRWHHLSNARIHGKEHNFGYDAPMPYLGLKRSF